MPSPEPDASQMPARAFSLPLPPLSFRKILVIKAGQALSLQLHREKDESSYLFSGRLRLTAGATEADLEDRVLEPGQSWRNEPGTIHSIEALEDSVVFEVSTPHLDDVIRLRDRYGRD
jgi:mannose-6-phosphate isomerase